MKRLLFLILISSVLQYLNSCSVQKPTEIDGTVTVKFVVIDTSGTMVTDPAAKNQFVPNAKIRMNTIDYSIPLQFETDENGLVEIKSERAARYRISAEKSLDVDYWTSIGEQPRTVMLSGSIEIDLSPADEGIVDTIKVGVSYLSSIVINEIYYSCCIDYLYFSDQFIELCNSSDSTQYLDKILICRLADIVEYPGYVKAIRYYQFPGTGKDHPIEPGQLVVIAMDAIDHVHVGGAKHSIDLSGADWEFYNQLSADLDNPNVPNVLNASSVSGGIDFMINLTADEICLVRVDDIDALPTVEESYKLISYETIIDAVEYSSNADHVKALVAQLDAGLAGYSIRSYSGKSIERHHPETGAPGYDTNNSSFDFVSLSRPTPGWQHSQEEIIPPFN
ncbi:MAG: DUF4876 domain-containing protein [bacterium]|nr:DUF4876 domain-containing protein [bacterium]